MESILENIVNAIEAAWFELASVLNLEEMDTLSSLKPVLTNILSDPLLLGLTLAIFAIIPYAIHKIKSSYTDKEKRLDALLKELDVEEDDLEPIFQNAKPSSFDSITDELKSEAYGDEFESPNFQGIESSPQEPKEVPQENPNQTPQEIFKNRSIVDQDFGWESSLEDWDELYDYISKPFRTEPKQEGESTTVPQESETTATASEDLNQTPQEIKDDDFSWDSDHDEWDELYDHISTKPLEPDQTTTVSSGEESLPGSTEKFSDEDVSEEEINENTVQTTEELTKEPSNMGIEELAELIEEDTALNIDQANEELAQGEEATSNLEPRLEEATEGPSNIGIEELAELIEEEEFDESAVKTSATSIPRNAKTESLDSDKMDSNLLEPTSSPTPKRIELTLEEVEPELATPVPQTTSKSPESNTEKPSTGPLLNSMLNSSVSAKTDALVSRLKTFHAELETRFQSLEKEPQISGEVIPTETLRKKQGDYQPAKVSYKSKRKSRSNKEYLRQLESFIFMARQKSKSTDVQ